MMSNKGKMIVLMLALTMMVLCPLAGPGMPHSSSLRPRASTEAGAEGLLHLTGLQLLRKGEPVDQLTTGERAKRYSIDLTGSGFDLGSRVFIGDRMLPTRLLGAAELTANLRGGRVPAPGELAVKVVNSDGQTSNTWTVDVSSDPADIFILFCDPPVAEVGATVMLAAKTGLTAAGNRLRFRGVTHPELSGLTVELPSTGPTLGFTVPSSVCPACSYSAPPCSDLCPQIAPGEYLVSVFNANGISNNVRLLVSEPNGPIGMWGGENVEVEVTDAAIRINGPPGCFYGSSAQPLQPDATGHFVATGLLSFPSTNRTALPAKFTGSIADGVMTLGIASTDSTPSTLGPYTLVFGHAAHFTFQC
jgi:hypothetical protein